MKQSDIEAEARHESAMKLLRKFEALKVERDQLAAEKREMEAIIETDRLITKALERERDALKVQSAITAGTNQVLDETRLALGLKNGQDSIEAIRSLIAERDAALAQLKESREQNEKQIEYTGTVCDRLADTAAKHRDALAQLKEAREKLDGYRRWQEEHLRVMRVANESLQKLRTVQDKAICIALTVKGARHILREAALKQGMSDTDFEELLKGGDATCATTSKQPNCSATAGEEDDLGSTQTVQPTETVASEGASEVPSSLSADLRECHCDECGADWVGPVGADEGLTRCKCGSLSVTESGSLVIVESNERDELEYKLTASLAQNEKLRALLEWAIPYLGRYERKERVRAALAQEQQL